jgi:hypothetical protein
MTKPTNDQKRCGAEIAPLIEGADGTSATMLSRMFLQGADPLFIAKMAQEPLRDLAKLVGITPDEVMTAIEKAHTMGPGIFESGEELGWTGDPKDFEPHHAGEVAWLILAGCSHDNEHGYTDEQTAEDRMRLAFEHTIRFANLMNEVQSGWAFGEEALLASFRENLLQKASGVLEDFRAKTKFEWDENDPKSVPTTDVDCGFYIGYKEGYSCVAVKAPGLIFYGTHGTHTLEEQGISVDKQISPQFGIVFGNPWK